MGCVIAVVGGTCIIIGKRGSRVIVPGVVRRGAIDSGMVPVLRMRLLVRYHGRRQGAVVRGAASGLRHRRQPLQGQRGDDQPKQQCLEGAMHSGSLAEMEATLFHGI